MSNDIRLQAYPTVPLYNIKAVEQSTQISSSTLRAWERRYHVCQPERSESGYRLYSDRDIAVIRWLKAQVDAGMSISQAVAWLDNLTAIAGTLAHVILPANKEIATTPMTPVTHHMQRCDYQLLTKELLNALLCFDEGTADRILAEAFALYPMEMVGENLITPALIAIGESWHRGEVSVTLEHFATAFLQQRLAAILRISPQPTKKDRIWVVCVPGEEHEIGALLLTIYLRRAGFQAQFLGKNIKAQDLLKDVAHYQPTLILLSATTQETAAALQALTNELATFTTFRPKIGYGGRIFLQHPELRKTITGIYMGDSAYEAVESTMELLVATSAQKSREHDPSSRRRQDVALDRGDDDAAHAHFGQPEFDADEFDTQ
ncbi:MAG: MerR family transcriptional regulator [Caldilineaceae bacterium]|nr:MerR family transcriptional regulator [Caldilineaceae bacterium]